MTTASQNPALASEIIDFYNRGLEQSRLTQGLGLLEWVRSQEIIRRHLPSATSTPRPVIYDVGGGPGLYSCWLASLGYDVHLVDAVPLHIEQACERSAAQSGRALASATLGDARQLDFEDASADAVLFHGPLYHLLLETDRLTALKEAARVLKPGGVLLAFAIPAYASTLVGLQRWWMNDPAYLAMCYTELSSGIHEPPQSWPDLFTTAYFHRPEALVTELEAAGFDHELTLAVEGPAVLVPDLPYRMANERERQVLLELVRSLEQAPLAVGMSAHIVAIAHKPAPAGREAVA